MITKRNRAQGLLEYIVIGGLVAVASLPLISPYAKQVGQRIADSAPKKNNTIVSLNQTGNIKIAEKGIKSANSLVTANNINNKPPEAATPKNPPSSPPPPPPPPRPSAMGCNDEDVSEYADEINLLESTCSPVTTADQNQLTRDLNQFFEVNGFFSEQTYYDHGIDCLDSSACDGYADYSTLNADALYAATAANYVDVRILASNQSLQDARGVVMSAMKKDGRFDCLHFNSYFFTYSNFLKNGYTYQQAKTALCELDPSSETKNDPYEVKIGDDEYVFVQDKNKDGQFNGKSEILGYTDTKDNLFKEMKLLDMNGDGYISSDELQKQGVKLMKMKDGKLTTDEYSLDKVKGIDLKSFQAATTFSDSDTAGKFLLDLNDNTTAEGKETFKFSSILDALVSAITNLFIFVQQEATDIGNAMSSFFSGS